jgi:hypothetical protein
MRGAERVIVAVKRNRTEAAADVDFTRYAEVTSAQRGWRFDLAILEGEDVQARDLRRARESPGEEIDKSLTDAQTIAGLNLVHAAMVAAWAGLEAAMRVRLRAAGEAADWRTRPRVLLSELYSSGILAEDEFRRLEWLLHVRSQIAHGFAPPTLDAAAVQFLIDLARRLLKESQQAKRSA